MQVRGDNVGALVLLIKMRPRTPQLAIIARDMAICLSTASFPPRVVHTPGIAHKVADLSSGVHQHSAIGNSAKEHRLCRIPPATLLHVAVHHFIKRWINSAPPRKNITEMGCQGVHSFIEIF